MFTWQYKIIRDNIHGYIKIPIPFVDLIDSEIFQRLRHIEQTGMRILYPSARHDRFIHSLGTYHLGVKAFEAFKENVKSFYSDHAELKRSHYKIKSDDKENEFFWKRCGVLFSIACLLHDCGHAPFSHTFEHIFDFQKGNLVLLNNQLLDIVNNDEFKNDFGSGKGKEHERMSAFLVKKEFDSQIKTIVKAELVECSDEDIVFIVRMIIGCTYQNITSKENQIKNCFIKLLNSEGIDVDGLDYIVRDSKLSGIDNVDVDVDRLLNSLTIVEKTHFKDSDLKDQVFNQVIMFDAKIEGEIDGIINGEIRVKEFSGEVKGTLSLEGRAKLDKVEITNGYGKVNGSYLHLFKLTKIEEIELCTTTSNSILMESAEFKSKEEQKIEMKTQQDTKAIIEMESVSFNGKMTGKFSGQVLGYFAITNSIPEVVLAFHKSSLSVLQNVIYARNYEYLWIYGHHKVCYYSNYLLVHALRKAVKYLIKDDAEADTDTVLRQVLTMDKPITYNLNSRRIISRQAAQYLSRHKVLFVC